MILDRHTLKAKLGHFDELVALVRAECEANAASYRIYTPIVGPANRVVFELQFADLAQREAFWAKWSARPETAAFMAKLNAMIENETTVEMCRLL